MSKHKCITCYWFSAFDYTNSKDEFSKALVKRGECRTRGPHPEYGFPKVELDAWCGDHSVWDERFAEQHLDVDITPPDYGTISNTGENK